MSAPLAPSLCFQRGRLLFIPLLLIVNSVRIGVCVGVVNMLLTMLIAPIKRRGSLYARILLSLVRRWTRIVFHVLHHHQLLSPTHLLLFNWWPRRLLLHLLLCCSGGCLNCSTSSFFPPCFYFSLLLLPYSYGSP